MQFVIAILLLLLYAAIYAVGFIIAGIIASVEHIKARREKTRKEKEQEAKRVTAAKLQKERQEESSLENISTTKQAETQIIEPSSDEVIDTQSTELEILIEENSDIEDDSIKTISDVHLETSEIVIADDMPESPEETLATDDSKVEIGDPINIIEDIPTAKIDNKPIIEENEASERKSEDKPEIDTSVESASQKPIAKNDKEKDLRPDATNETSQPKPTTTELAVFNNIIYHIKKLKGKSYMIIFVDSESHLKKGKHPFLIKTLKQSKKRRRLP